MSEMRKIACDTCGRETANSYNEHGWIIIRGASISIALGRRKNGTARAGFLDILTGMGGRTDFCSTRCLVSRIEKLKTEAPE